MSPDEFALMQAVRANPADDLPRLVYADFLEERGDESSVARAEFIRVQCTLARLSQHEAGRFELAQREATLLATYRKLWDAETRRKLVVLAPELKDGRFASMLHSWIYHRGMIASVHLNPNIVHRVPILQQSIGPIEHLSFSRQIGYEWQVDSVSPWEVEKLKVLSLRAIQTGTGHNQYDTFIDNRTFRTVPILDLTRVATGIPILDFLGIMILRGELNPLILLPSEQAPGWQVRIPRVFDPLSLWSLVGPWAEQYVLSVRNGVQTLSWNRLSEHWSAIPSVRMRHLVNYYRLAGLPTPAEVTSRPYPQAEREQPPRRGILSRATRWFRRGR